MSALSIPHPKELKFVSFLEAAYLVCLENELLMQQVLEVAQARRQERRETGILRRAKSMTRYLQDS